MRENIKIKTDVFFSFVYNAGEIKFHISNKIYGNTKIKPATKDTNKCIVN